jgi:subtilase family serine protease
MFGTCSRVTIRLELWEDGACRQLALVPLEDCKVRISRALPAALLITFALTATAAFAQPLQRDVAAVVPQRNDVRDLGRAHASMPVDIAVTLSYRDEDELARLVSQQGDSRSPLFHRFLSNAQFDAFFGPTQAEHASVIAALQSAGFTITGTYENRTLIEARGPAVAAERYFGTEIHSVYQAGVGNRYANSRPAYMPSELQGRVVAVSGLDNLLKAHYDHVFGRPSPGMIGDKIGGKLHGPDGGFGPVAIAQGFDFPVQHGFDGTGHAVANVAGTVLDTDIKSFLHFFGITRTGKTSRVLIEGSGQWNPGDPAVVEATLDVEDMASLAPGANIVLYILENPVDVPGEKAYNRIVSDNKVEVVNSSFGICETQDPAYEKAAHQIAMQGNAKGITFSASSGDSGSGQCSGNGIGQSAPATNINFVSVGGTSLQVDSHARYLGEQGWSGSGGGISSLLKIPTYQKGVKGKASLTMRNVPDIAFPADPGTGFSYLLGGSFQGPIGGTSWSSPTYCALQVEVNEKKHSRAGDVNAAIYEAFVDSGYTVFHDIILGNNGSFSAHKGYDNVTGIGSIRGFPFAGIE